MASEFAKDNQQTDNPFVDKLLKNLKILAYNCIIKDENAADKAETEESLKNAELYAACIENRVSLALFEYIPDQFLRRAGLPNEIINLYHVYHENVEVIPKDDDETHYRYRLVSMLRPWFISNYEEKNEYYRMITGKPKLNDWGIPVRDYEKYLPDNFRYTGEFVHEIGVDACRELDHRGVLDIIKNDYPDAKYLNYVTAGITSYDARKNLDFMILYTPSDADYNITEEFLRVYQDRREYLLRNVYSSVMELQSEHYHAVMQIYLLIMTMSDMLADVQSHMVKKDILDRRCIEYLFSMYGVPYFRTIPYKFQERICMNLHNLIKYKSCTEGLEQIAKLFDLEDVEFFKYYLVKERLKDQYGELLYSGKIKLTCVYNDIIEIETAEDNLGNESVQTEIPDGIEAYNLVGYSNIDRFRYSENDFSLNNNTSDDRYFTKRYINWPFDYFLQKGNKVLVVLGDKLLEEGIDYDITGYNVLKLYDSATMNNPSNILKYYFYYDITTKDKDFNSDINHSVQLNMFTSTKHKTNEIKIESFKFPYNYYLENDAILVFVDSKLLKTNEFMLDGSYIIIDDSIEIVGHAVTIIMLYSKDLDIVYNNETITAEIDGQNRFSIPEPFVAYVVNGNSFLLFANNELIDPTRYDIDVTDVTITFNDGTTFDEGESFDIVHLYSKGSIISSMNLKIEDYEIKVDSAYQTTFEFHMPIKDFVEKQFKAFVNVFNSWLPFSSFTFTNDQIIILDESLALRKGDKVKIKLAYVEQTNADATNIKVTETNQVVTEDRQSDFEIEAPIENFFEKNGKLIVSAQGQYLPPEDYEVDLDAGTFIITNYKRYLYKNQILVFTFIFYDETTNQVNVALQKIPAEGVNQYTRITLNYPFFPYLETNQSFLVMYNNEVIPKDRIHIKDSFTIMIDEFEKIDEADTINILYFYSSYYDSYINQGFVMESTTVDIDENTTSITIPEPIDGYINNNWPYLVTYNNGTILPETNYDVIEKEFNTFPLDDLHNGVYGDKITFNFVYPPSNTDYIWSEIIENSEDNTKLVFCKVPVKDINSTQYLLDSDLYKDFDMTVAKDGWWTGLNYKDNNYDQIKNAIYNMPLNFCRSKYYGLGRVIEFSSHTAKMAFFYSELFDDVFLEEKLNVTIQSISEIHSFNIAHLILYMTCLTYIYNNQDEVLIETPTAGISVTGFNFRASMDEVRRMIEDAHFDPNDFDIWDFIIPTKQIESIDKFVKIHANNEKVYHLIRNKMVIAESYSEYKIWNDIYEKLMTWEYNTEYYRLKSGKIARTFSEFLEEKDPTLYASLETIKNIADNEEKIDTITNIIDDICYILEDHLTKDLSRFVFSDFVGHSSSSILDYMMNIINFFKSHKIVFSERGEVVNVGGNGVRRLNEDSVIKYYDNMTMLSHNVTKDYIGIVENLNLSVFTHYNENEEFNAQGNHWIREDCQITTFMNNKKEEIING